MHMQTPTLPHASRVLGSAQPWAANAPARRTAGSTLAALRLATMGYDGLSGYCCHWRQVRGLGRQGTERSPNVATTITPQGGVMASAYNQSYRTRAVRCTLSGPVVHAVLLVNQYCSVQLVCTGQYRSRAVRCNLGGLVLSCTASLYFSTFCSNIGNLRHLYSVWTESPNELFINYEILSDYWKPNICP